MISSFNKFKKNRTSLDRRTKFGAHSPKRSTKYDMPSLERRIDVSSP